MAVPIIPYPIIATTKDLAKVNDIISKMAQKKEAIYDAGKLAKFFGVTKRTARGWCKKGKLPAFKIGKEWKIRVADLQKMIDQEVSIRENEKSSRLF